MQRKYVLPDNLLITTKNCVAIETAVLFFIYLLMFLNIALLIKIGKKKKKKILKMLVNMSKKISNIFFYIKFVFFDKITREMHAFI